MKSNKIDYRLFLGILLAAGLMYVTFDYATVFWYLYGASMLFLISWVILNDELKKHYSILKSVVPGIFSGIVLYILFYIGALLLKFIPGNMDALVAEGYGKYEPDSLLIWILLVVAIVPGEEIFWRGFVLKRLEHDLIPWVAVLIMSVLNGALMLFSGNFIIALAAALASIFWGFIYVKRPSLSLLIISHWTFNLLLLLLLPIY
ncbi:CAAX amino terminal membrane protease family protein [Listeria weihenstephanensis FSL R9-0317]|uniref:CAAX protease n=1 Tax=Listeria weihenstephanensis TaxID=1006155 RepID=A0A1S7FW97_9LIST|nr:type II CAAX endopeptidase family protein [Listeria weihenstephanensis]AQY51721.1 CAAX protease [Listeria weihenstephanensis]EUJ41265.1 CAAX amino terminal membrane protease family protein [Listeria weihenstephanensis FSL R9-0317]MBC1500553.1 CPBP family intramembrane metalloprotease [Listeria weihenstephanensis]